MFTVDIIFLEHRAIPSPLTFYSKDVLTRGTILYATLRGTKILSIVTACEPLHTKKNDIRAQTFQLKKIDGKSTVAVMDEATLARIEKIALLQALPLSLVLECIIPAHLQENTHLLQPFLNRISEWCNGTRTEQVHYFEHDLVYRLDHYKSIVRDALTKKQSVVIVAPTINHALTIQSVVCKGLEHKSIILSSDLTKKDMRIAYDALYADTKEKYVVCATAHYALSLPDSVHTYIIDQESHPSYYSFDAPAYDYKMGLQLFAQESTSNTIVADTLLRMSSYKALQEEKAVREFSIHGRFARSRNVTISTPREGSTFSYIHEDVIDACKNIKKQECVFIYAPRKGIHSSLVCRDCASVYSCVDCNKPYSVHGEKTGIREVRCTHCRTKNEIPSDQELLCGHCGSWRMEGHGVTIHALKEALLPHVKQDIYVAEKDSSTSIEKICKIWQENGGILIGTDACIPHIHTKMPYAVIGSIDGWFTMPDIDPTRRLMHVLEPLLELTQKMVYVQTKSPHNETFAIITEPSFERYIQKELEERKELEQPPYTTFVLIRKLTSMTVEEAKRTQSHFIEYDAHIYKVHTDIRVLLRVPTHIFNASDTLQHELQDLYPYMTVEINPLSLFTPAARVLR